jgi:prepilin-type N-terminal cleavage/methylation domain-containing protein
MTMNKRTRRSFTLIELLVVMGVIALLAAVTALGYRGIAKDTKLASGKNTVMAVLENARGLAMKNNEITGVVFRARLDNNKNYIEASIVKWSRQTARARYSQASQVVIDRLIPVAGTPVRRLPVGIQIAAPFYSGSTTHPCNGQVSENDNVWVTCSHLAAINQDTGTGETPGSMLAVLYSPSGNTISRNSHTSADRMWVDFNNDRLQQLNGANINYWPTTGQYDFGSCSNFYGTPNQDSGPFQHKFELDEPFIDIAAYLAVFDDDAVRELYVPSDWNSVLVGSPQAAYVNRRDNYTQYITNNADRIHFNRYTGVAMR